jgi:HD-GYP domain-containing protein (c-di-GMP phosphodiesterase class II)
MADQSKNIREVTLEKLTDDMKIVSYRGFADKYKHIDKTTCEWLQHNFQRSHVIIRRAGKMIKVLASQIHEGDDIIEIGKFPESLRKITLINDALIHELKKRGFTKFKVTKLAKKPEVGQNKMKIATDKANDLVEKVSENIGAREKAIVAVENFIDDARKGIINEAAIKGFVTDYVSNTSKDALNAIASLKQSDQTYGHCVDVAGLFHNIYSKIVAKKGRKNIFKNEQEITFAGFIHDFGKSKIPKDILDSTVRFEMDSPEMEMMRAHPRNGVELLKEINQPDYILNMTHYHHLKLDPNLNSSYPKVDPGTEIIYETRLLAIIDIYQALIGKRSYKKSWSPSAAVRYIDALAGIEMDMDVWDDFMEIVGYYPISTLVELSDDSVAFVMNVPDVDVMKPQVVVVRDPNGMDISDHSILDLQENQEITIVRDLDAHDFFGDQALSMFTKIKLK